MGLGAGQFVEMGECLRRKSFCAKPFEDGASQLGPVQAFECASACHVTCMGVIGDPGLEFWCSGWPQRLAEQAGSQKDVILSMIWV